MCSILELIPFHYTSKIKNSQDLLWMIIAVTVQNVIMCMWNLHVVSPNFNCKWLNAETGGSRVFREWPRDCDYPGFMQLRLSQSLCYHTWHAPFSSTQEEVHLIWLFMFTSIFTKEVNLILAKLSLNFNGSLAKIGLTTSRMGQSAQLTKAASLK